MAKSIIKKGRKKKIRKLLSMMGKQNQRFFPITPPLVEMMDLTISDPELDFLLKMNTTTYSFEQASTASEMSDDQFNRFFKTIKQKGLVDIEYGAFEDVKYSLNAIAVGWYEGMMHYLVGDERELEFSENWLEYFKYFRKFNHSPLRAVQNLVMENILKTNQSTTILNPGITKPSKRKTIPINSSISNSDTNIYPTFYANDIISEYGNEKAIYAFPCVCRHGNSVMDSPCGFDIPKYSCISFGDMAKYWASLGWGREVSPSGAVEILADVQEKGAIHSVIHEKDDTNRPIIAICNCCWDCCGILKHYNIGAISLKYKVSFTARIKDDAKCKGCGNCEKFCPTTAISVHDGTAALNDKRCIGCGQCAYQCPQNNIELYPNVRTVFLPILKRSEARVTG